MTTNHTPGPWSVNSYISQRDDSSPTSRRNILCATVDTADGHLINAANCQVAAIFARNRAADARLIAAAPDLLSALEYWFDSTATAEEIAKRARVAIAKAKGQS